ncbi:DUF2207 family protein [Arachnia rubra]|uniref:DUF2207 domain-containing protein n=1 Tax=Arachnia rubra TaxID=1547448 RepID=A0ABX7Y316_9ACTN|nr:DUF2207 domain-containing protein [Arachnia rubra]MDO4646280.1 DUF2207 domain-containing protein [Propionibacteriaceae bacterium]QUC07550.1 DUF2207 domain-containing protein [Arachnia rubra]BCR81848.1 hypothetical protein SK1NUM_22910 [Arachnia rubra]
MRLFRLLLVPFTLLLCYAGTPQAHAEDPIAKSYVFEGQLDQSGVLKVTETIQFDTPPAELTQRIANQAPIDRERSYTYDISGMEVTGAENVDTKVEGDYTVVSMKPSTTVKISYQVTGTTRREPGSNGQTSVFTWRALQGLSVATEKASGTLQVGATPQLVDCTAGPPGALDKCQVYTAGTHNSLTPMFETSARGAGEQVTFTVGFASEQVAPTEEVHEQWNLDRAFRIDLATAGAALATLVVGALLLWWLHRRTGADLSFSGDVAAVGSFRPVGDGESVFEPAEGMRPGLVGTVADERVDPIDVTATLIDLAVRGHLRITELQHTQYGLVDWQFSRLENPGDELAPYEALLLDAVVPDGSHSLASQLPQVLAPALGGVQDALYNEVVERGWFESRPDSTRSSWAVRGWVGLGVAVAAGAALVAFTTFGLVALVLLALAIALLWIAPRMPRRTPEGTRLVAALGALSALLATHPTDQMPKGRELAEISRLLPYTVVLGARQRWLEAMAAADDDDTPDPTDVAWYHAPKTWHLRDLPPSLNQFINTVQGQLFSR